MNVLDERFHAFANFTFPHFLALLLAAYDFVARKRFAKHGDERAVTGKKDSVRGLVRLASRREIQADQSFSCPGNASDKANSFATFGFRFINEFLDAPRGDVQILRASVEARDRFNGMLRVERTGSFDDSRRRMI